jgi:hypothetical protein
MTTWNEMSSEQRIHAAMQAASEDLTPEYVAVLRDLPPGVRLRQAFALWRMAKEALVRQELANGRSRDDALKFAARRMLELADDASP